MDSRGNSFEGYRVRMSPRNIAGAGANFSYKDFNWNLTANYMGNRNLRDNTVTSPQKLPSYTTVNTALTYSFKIYIAVSCGKISSISLDFAMTPFYSFGCYIDLEYATAISGCNSSSTGQIPTLNGSISIRYVCILHSGAPMLRSDILPLGSHDWYL